MFTHIMPESFQYVNVPFISALFNVDTHVTLPLLFCTSIWTEPERKSVIIFLILNGFSCNKRQIFRRLQE